MIFNLIRLCFGPHCHRFTKLEFIYFAFESFKSFFWAEEIVQIMGM